MNSVCTHVCRNAKIRMYDEHLYIIYIYCMCAYMNKDSDGLLSRCELRAVLASFFIKHCHRTIQEDATALSAALFSVLDPQKLGYIDSDGTNIYI